MIDHVGVLAHPIPLEPVDAAQVLDGEPRIGGAVLGTIGNREYGVWEMTPGAMSDVETDEVCVFLAGSGTVEFIDLELTIDLRAGTVIHFDNGSRSIWRVTETLRKVWIA